MKIATLHVVALATALLAAACGKSEQAPPSAPGETPAPASAPVAAAPHAPALPHRPAVPANTEMAVYTVDSVILVHPPDSPGAIAVKVSGTVRTGGWTNMRLVEVSGIDRRADVQSYKFVATSPPQGGATRGMQRAQTELRLASLPPDVKTLRVVAETNEVSAALPP